MKIPGKNVYYLWLWFSTTTACTAFWIFWFFFFFRTSIISRWRPIEYLTKKIYWCKQVCVLWEAPFGVWDLGNKMQRAGNEGAPFDIEILIHTCIYPSIHTYRVHTYKHTQVVIPHVTASYGDGPKDQEDEDNIPMCTLRNFPNLIEHCIEWARAKFTDYFVVPATNMKKVKW